MTRAVTSASNIFRRLLCPGSGNAEAACKEERSIYSDEGDLLHSHKADPEKDRSKLSDQHQTLLAIADQEEARFVELAMRVMNISPGEPMEVFREQKLEFYDPEGKVIFPGHADAIYIWPEIQKGAVLDYKFGFIEVTKAKDNEQLACYGVMLMDRAYSDFSKLNQIAVGIVQPRMISDNRLTMAVYNSNGIEEARKALAEGYYNSLLPDAPRITGDRQCSYCRAKIHCDAYRAQVAPVLTAPEPAEVGFCTNDQLERLIIAIRFASKVKDPAFNELRERIKEGTIEGWQMVDSGKTRECTDASRAFRILKGFFEGNEDFTAEKFMQCVEIHFGALETYFASLTGFTGKRAKATLSKLLDPVLEYTPKNPTPKKVKP